MTYLQFVKARSLGSQLEVAHEHIEAPGHDALEAVTLKDLYIGYISDNRNGASNYTDQVSQVAFTTRVFVHAGRYIILSRRRNSRVFGIARSLDVNAPPGKDWDARQLRV